MAPIYAATGETPCALEDETIFLSKDARANLKQIMVVDITMKAFAR